MEHGLNGRNEKRNSKMTLEEELAEASLTIREEPESEKHLDEGYYLDEDYEDDLFDFDFDDEFLTVPDRKGTLGMQEEKREEKAVPEDEDGKDRDDKRIEDKRVDDERIEDKRADDERIEDKKLEARRIEAENRDTQEELEDWDYDYDSDPERDDWEEEYLGEGGRRTAYPETADPEEEYLDEEEISRTSEMKESSRTKDKAGSKGAKGKGGAGKKVALAVCGTAGALCLAGVGAYLVKAESYREAFCPNTVINGFNAEGMTVDEVKASMSSRLDDYEIRLLGRNGEETVLTKEDLGLYTVFDGTLEQMIQGQNPLLWGMSWFGGTDSSVDALVAYDETKFSSCMDALPLLQEENVLPYRQAYLSDYIEGKGYEVVPEDPGTAVDKEKLTEALSKAVLSLEPELSLEESGCYEREQQEPPKELTALCDHMNKYATMTVTYTFGSQEEVLNGDQIHQWITFGDNYEVAVDGEKVSEYVAALGKKYNTAYTERTFSTSYGKDVKVSGYYGWRIDQQAETEALEAIIAAGDSQVREPIYSQTGASHDGTDYGDTYAEVNLTAQHLIFYKDGEKILESDFVSGNVARGHTTPPGIFGITYKQRDAVLKGQGYASPVKFWMPFNGGIGFHDASWRNQFGGSIYRTNGSHGCVNMPYQAAKTLFENIYTGMPVICYNLDGTESKNSTKASGSGGGPFVNVAPAVTAPVPAPLPLPLPSDPVLPSDPAANAPAPEVTAPASSMEYGPGMETSPANGTEAGPGAPSQAPAETPAPAPGPGETPAPAPAPAPETPPASAPAPETPPAPAPAPEAPPAPAPDIPTPAAPAALDPGMGAV